MANWRPDPTFHPSPRMAMEAPAEKLGYVAILHVEGRKPDARFRPSLRSPTSCRRS